MAPRALHHLIRRTRRFFGRSNNGFLAASTVAVAGSVCGYLYYWKSTDNIINASKETPPKRRYSEGRFLNFASAEYNGQIYMTPIDFLESLIELEPRKRTKRAILTDTNLETIKEKTPPIQETSATFFRDLGYTGIISYADYLFLLSMLTKPQSCFRVAFSMHDLDGSGLIDRAEYGNLAHILSAKWQSEKVPQISSSKLDQSLNTQVPTTLTIHFFGVHGERSLSYDIFSKFMNDLQNEILEVEFVQFSRGLNTITEMDFLKILLRYSNLDEEHYQELMERCLARFENFFDMNSASLGITLEEYRKFMNFLNNLADLMTAMRIYAITNMPITKIAFQRAALIVSGHALDEHVVDTIFTIFDSEGNGALDSAEFFAVTKERTMRDFRQQIKSTGWNAFRKCVSKIKKKNQLKQQKRHAK